LAAPFQIWGHVPERKGIKLAPHAQLLLLQHWLINNMAIVILIIIHRCLRMKAAMAIRVAGVRITLSVSSDYQAEERKSYK